MDSYRRKYRRVHVQLNEQEVNAPSPSVADAFTTAPSEKRGYSEAQEVTDTASGNKVFISLNKKDKKIAEQVKASLKEKGIESWLFSDDMESGNFVEQIDKSMNNSRFFLLLLSQNALESKWVNFEIDMAISLSVERKLAVIVLVVGKYSKDSLPPKLMPFQMYLGGRNYGSSIQIIVEQITKGTTNGKQGTGKLSVREQSKMPIPLEASIIIDKASFYMTASRGEDLSKSLSFREEPYFFLFNRKNSILISNNPPNADDTFLVFFRYEGEHWVSFFRGIINSVESSSPRKYEVFLNRRQYDAINTPKLVTGGMDAFFIFGYPQVLDFADYPKHKLSHRDEIAVYYKEETKRTFTYEIRR